MIEQDLERMEQGEMDNESTEMLAAMQPWQCDRYRRTDIGNANIFADFFGDRARYMKDQQCWYVYDGRAWRMDASGLEVRALIKALAEVLSHYTRRFADPVMRDLAFEQLKRWQSRKGRMEILSDAEDVHPLTMDMMDADPMLLNCQNGTLDLDTGVMHPHHPGDLLTRVCGADYIPGVRCERWESFVLEVMRKSAGQLSLNDEEEAERKAAWLQRIFGYALTGDTRLECMFVLYGQTTRNGKSTMMETMLHLMGDYGCSMLPESLAARTDRRGASGPSEDVARLRGMRLVSASEPDKQLHLSASLVKTLTGNDTVTARNLYQSSFQYRPQFKLFLNTNHLPETNDATLFESGRVKLIPFERHFEPREQDRSLKWFLTQPFCLTGILNWCMDGLRALREEGFSLGSMPETARRSLAAYRAENDHPGRFVQECLAPEDGRAERSADVYKAYVSWCRENGVPSESAAAFRRELGKRYRLGRARVNGSDPTTVVFDCRIIRGM